jgi:acyl transferase domain-containing protein
MLLLRRYLRRDWTKYRKSKHILRRANIDIVYREEPPSPMGAFLKEPTRFDNVEFGIAMKDAMSMSASTRQLIELAFLACLDSGVDSRGKRIGVFSAGTNMEAFEFVRLQSV